MATKRASADDELARLRAAVAEPHAPEATKAITVALSSKHARVVAAAAQLIKARRLEGFAPALEAAYRRFLEEPVKRDAGCQAKLAILEALDFTEEPGAELFLSAASLVQLEPAWGQAVDTAAGCRARAVLALSRLGHGDLVLVAGPLLADAEVPVRLAAADALAHSGVRAAAGLLLHKLAVGDEDPLVSLACMSGVLTLAPEVALARFVPLLDGRDTGRRELAAMCLGQSSRADAGHALLTALEACALSKDRAVLLQALGVHRSDAALEALLEVIASGNPIDALGALRALAPRRFEPGVRGRVATVVSRRGEPELERELDATFEREQS